MPEVIETRWNRLTAAELNALAAAGAVVLLPIGSTEQHGPHLPTGVDDFLATEVCARAVRELAGRAPVVLAPSIPFGLAEHHMAFGGTLTLSLPTLHALLRDLCKSLLRAGFRRILVVNGHGGNMTALHALVTELTAELPARIGLTNYFTLAREEIQDTLEAQPGLMHACEGETSMIMAAWPELVRAQHLPAAVGPPITLPAESTAPAYFAVSFKDFTASGVAGDARGATPVKGERLLAASATALCELLLGDEWARP
ncbi:creatininase family protein [Crossiella cryophila]|uniref:Creatinine amidohydrolase n=1 Tax=Crossiella cryophila TaxID=43355 RepID=A0A7W7CHR7_9PSEU|nr:creatininase family protein [Crossiella cryophila]MBB4679953.1 creatinine amidohydrolase [Crossiella cryophila]